MTNGVLSLSIRACGMVSAVGFNFPATCTAMRGSISGVRKGNLWDARSGDYISAGRAPLPQWWEGAGKLADLVAPAIYECALAAPRVPLNQIPILISIAAPDRPHRDPSLDVGLLDEVAFRLKTQLHSASAIFARGRVGGLVALQEANRLIYDGSAPCCIVAGVDSFLQQDMVQAYIDRRRILTQLNSNGFIPGEAGAALLVTLPGVAPPGGEVRVLSFGFDREMATIESEEPLRAEGLTRALGGALDAAGITMFDIDYRLTDMNGEHYKFKETTLATMRFERKFDSSGRIPRVRRLELWHPIEYLGDIGAAIIPCLIGVAFHSGQKGYAPGRTALCYAGEDSGERAVTVMRFMSAEGNS